MQINRAKGNLPCKVNAEHGHAGDPEKQNVVSGYEYARRVVALEVRCFLGPAESRKRPQSGAEPRVEHVRILFELRRSARATGACRVSRHGHVRVLFAIPSGNAMPPP